MVKKAALKTAGISMAGFQPRAKVIDGQTPPADSSPAGPAAKPFTGVGNVMAAITREAELSKALSGTRAALDAATQQLDQLRSADVIQALDARAVQRSHWANRIEAEFSTPEFALLKEDIASAGGNVQPIKVRRIAGAALVFDGQTPAYEIVFGHRRHRACLELGLAVLAVVVDRMDDRALFEAMDRENRGRKNLSAWEQGRMYDEAIRKGLYASLRRLSESLVLPHEGMLPVGLLSFCVLLPDVDSWNWLVGLFCHSLSEAPRRGRRRPPGWAMYSRSNQRWRHR